MFVLQDVNLVLMFISPRRQLSFLVQVGVRWFEPVCHCSPSDFQVDFDQLQDNLCQMERRCKASWDHLKAIAKHEMKPVLKQRMSEFLKDCAERIIILKIVHRRIINR